MKESNCGRIPPCYGSLERAIYEEAKMANEEWKKSRALHGKLIDKLRGKLMEGGFLDDTPYKVYGLNKQMCDIGKRFSDPLDPISEEAIQEAIKALEITRKPKGIIMEEKKTKKMTKAEAFEWLKCKKIDACGYLEEVQEKLFSVGITWITGDTFVARHGIYLFINEDGELTHGGCDEVFWKRHLYEEIRAEDILSLEIEEECSKDDEDPYFGGRIKDLQEMIKDEEVLIITKTNFLTMTK